MYSVLSVLDEASNNLHCCVASKVLSSHCSGCMHCSVLPGRWAVCCPGQWAAGDGSWGDVPIVGPEPCVLLGEFIGLF